MTHGFAQERLHTTREVAQLREEMAAQHGRLTVQIAESAAVLRTEMAERETRLRGDMKDGYASLRLEIATGRADLIKWSFLFWVGQVITVAGLVGVMLRLGMDR
jgi:hypothetical protein